MHPTDVRPARTPAPARTGHRRRRGILILLAGLCGLASAGLTYLGLTQLTTPSLPPVMSGPAPAWPTAAATGAAGAHPAQRAPVSWPAGGFSAADISGAGVVAGPGAGRPVPIASVAKLMTAYVVLHDHPLPAGGPGPEITVQPSEAAAYPAQVREGDSLVPVTAGEHLTERQALAALLLPSADNVAWILARWDAGRQAAFLTRMNATAQRLGMTGTHYTDPSGLDPSTTSTAADQVRLGTAAMRVPALAAITALPAAVVPVAGLVRNTNTLLGQDGIAGLKTGSTQAAGGCLLVAAWSQVRGRPVLIVAATLGQPGSAGTILPHALQAGHDLVLALDRAFGATPGVVPQDRPAAPAVSAWNRQVSRNGLRSAHVSRYGPGRQVSRFGPGRRLAPRCGRPYRQLGLDPHPERPADRRARAVAGTAPGPPGH